MDIARLQTAPQRRIMVRRVCEESSGNEAMNPWKEYLAGPPHGKKSTDL